jgi:hypothetical protein
MPIVRYRVNGLLVDIEDGRFLFFNVPVVL